MWLVGNNVLNVYVSTHSIRAVRGDKIAFHTVNNPWDDSITEFRSWLSDQEHKPKLRVWLSGGLCRPFLLTPPDGINKSIDLIAIASATASAATGLAGPCTAKIDKHHNDVQFIAIAMPSQVLTRLRELSALSIQPWWAPAFSRLLKNAPTARSISIQDDDSITLLAGSQTSFQVATTISPINDPNSGQAALDRVMFSHALSAIECSIRLNFASTPTEEDSLDLRIPFWQWAKVIA